MAIETPRASSGKPLAARFGFFRNERRKTSRLVLSYRATARQAADGIARTTDAVTTRPLDTAGAGMGHERPVAAVADFLARWQGGVEELCADGREIADRLRGAADAYARSDEQGRRTLDGVLRMDTGPDPAAGR